jgi:hypothetical protein
MTLSKSERLAAPSVVGGARRRSEVEKVWSSAFRRRLVARNPTA